MRLALLRAVLTGMRRPISSLGLAWAALLSSACGGGNASDRAEPQAEDAWLSAVGSGPAQTARVCQRGASDRVATALCAAAASPIRNLQELYVRLGLDQTERRTLAVTTHSLGLSARIVSGANPRVLLNPKRPPGQAPSYEDFVSVAFSRGEQLVELVGLDPVTTDYNFYLLRFEQSCNASRCAPEDLLTERVETGWNAWTLYADQDLEDTPLACSTCHLPFGAGSHKLLLMRQTLDPWMQWSDFHSADEHLCPGAPDGGPPYRVVATSHGLDPMVAAEAATGSYAALPLLELQAAPSGAALVDFMVDAQLFIDQASHPPYPYAQLDFPTREVLCERFYTGKSPTWDTQRTQSLAQGLPVPFYEPDVFDPAEQAAWLHDRTAFLRSRVTADAFDVAAGLLRPEVAPAVGFVPRPDDSAPEMLRSFCVRCHAANVDPALRRGLFNAEALAPFEPATARAIRARLTLPKSSPALMPPRRVGELPDWAIERIDDFLRERCAEPGGCN